MNTTKIFTQFLIIMLLTETLSAKEAPREFLFSSLLSGFETKIELSQTLTPRELIKPVSIDNSCHFDMPSIFQYLWI